MGLFDFLFKSKEERIRDNNLKFFNKLRKSSMINEVESMMKSIIQSSAHDDSRKDENPDGKGEFGHTKTNPVPVFGLDNVPAYMDKLRYEYISPKTGSNTFNPITYQRTTESDKLKLGAKKPNSEPVGAACNSHNIKGHIDVYNIFNISNEKIAMIYINSYSLKTSDKVPDGFIHRSDVPVLKDGKLLALALKK